MSRLGYSIKNAKISFLFTLALSLVNFFSRSVFLDTLGENLVGLSALAISYIGMLNLMELGISTAVAQALYQPLFKKQQREITEIVSLFGYLFRWVGIALVGGGLIFSAFIPKIFEDDIALGLDLRLIYLAFFSFLFTTLLSYWVNYKQNLLVANQKGYKVNVLIGTCQIVKTLAQMAGLIYLDMGYVAWLGLEILFGVVFSVWLEVVVRREYPWLRASVRQGRAVRKKYGNIFANVKRIFSHKIGTFVLQQSDPIIIQLLMGVASVAYYTNYTLLTSRVTTLIAGALSNSYAGVGDLIQEGNRQKTKSVFWQFNALYFWIGGIVAFGFFVLIVPLLPIWLKDSDKYVVYSNWVIGILAFNLFVSIIRQTAQYFLNGYGLFQDVWASWCEAGLNIAVSLTAGYYYGIVGVVAGTAVSTSLFVVIWKPIFLFRKGFREPSLAYWLTFGKLLLTLAAAIAASYWLFADVLRLPEATDWSSWLVQAAVLTLLYTTLSGAMLWCVSSGMRALVRVGLGLVKKKK